MKLILRMDLDNAMFDPHVDAGVADVFESLVAIIDEGPYGIDSIPRIIKDINGNTIGTIDILKDYEG